MRFILLLSVFLCSVSVYSQSIYDYKVSDIQGDTFDLASLKGKKVMIVNTASKCGYTPQFKQLQELYETYGAKNFIIIGFPTNDFLNQDPGSNKEIESFCVKNYGVTFPMMSKITVKGKNMHPLYKYLTQKSQNQVEDSAVKWNFQKYLIDENGKYIGLIPSSTLPNDSSVIEWIETGNWKGKQK